jgi:hypothetical protein
MRSLRQEKSIREPCLASKEGDTRMNSKGIFGLLLAVVALSACATIPAGPSVRVLPGPGKSLEAFQSDDAACRQWASQQVGTEASENANRTLATGAAAGAVLGGLMGAAIGGGHGHAGAGFGIGAASGALVGTAAASGPASEAQYEAQRRYDNAYMQCIYAKGNQVPGYAGPPTQAVPPLPPPVAVQPQEPPITANVEPPPLRQEVMVPPPSPQYVWIQGHWAWNGRWMWEPGYWVIPPRPYARWVPGHWRHHRDGWVWVPGNWRSR